ncbi:LacI family DNA-binding transcriptional regulator [Microbacterium sp. NPDC058389]|uniref:LacI family DNA-binding transcriptional regulator n=1 Tax=Microbacterium sp. NPDC058389 TaxID=3346475 RepID=UPI003668F723
MSAERRVTSADVARASGVSRATVSYVINNVPGRSISQATRELVLRTAKDLGHVPFAPARSLRLGHSSIVLALVRDFTLGYVSSTVLHQLDVALVERGYGVVVHRLDEELRPLRELLGMVSPALVITMGGLSLDEEAARAIAPGKLLRVHGYVPNAMAGRMQAEYLAQSGHTRLGYALPASASLALIAEERLQGVRSACLDLHVTPPLVEKIDPNDPATVFAALDSFLAHGVTAVAAHNDEIALMFTAALVARDLHPGTDMAVIGVDNIPAARIALTTVEIDVQGWGAAVVQSALSVLDDEEPAPIGTDFLRLIRRTTA